MGSIWLNGLCGTIGGLAGAFAMHRFRIVWEDRQNATPENAIFGFDEEADLNAVDRLWDWFSLPALPREEALRVALLLHYGFGAFSGGAYGILSETYPGTRSASGLLLGFSLWLVGDELAVSVTGLSNPASKAFAAHSSALFAHLLFGAIAELSRKSLCRWI